MSAICPECERRLKGNAHLSVGEHIFCPNCDEMYTITNVDPIELDWDYGEQKDDIDEDDISMDVKNRYNRWDPDDAYEEEMRYASQYRIKNYDTQPARPTRVKQWA